MQPGRIAVAAVFAVVLSVTLISGPLVAPIDLTTATNSTDSGPDDFSPGTGGVNATVVSTPDTVIFDKADFGAGSYNVEVPPAIVDIHSIEGQPLLIYKLKVPEMGYTRQTTLFLSEDDTGRRQIVIEEQNLEPDEVTQDEYDGRIIILTRVGDEDTILIDKDITVRVTS